MGLKSPEEIRLKLANKELEEKIARASQAKKQQKVNDANVEAAKRNLKSQHHSISSAKQEDKAFPRLFPIDADVFRGSSIFTKQCGSCHTLELNSSSNRIWGPAIGNIYGRVSGADLNYTYSKKLSDSFFRWNRNSLFEFIKTQKMFVYQRRRKDQLLLQ